MCYINIYVLSLIRKASKPFSQNAERLVGWRDRVLFVNAFLLDRDYRGRSHVAFPIGVRIH